MIAALSEAERNNALAALPQWKYDHARRALYRRITLADFSAAFGLMTRIALEAEKSDHHPEWENIYNRIDIWLTTHDADDISPRDVALAHAIDLMVT